MTAPPAVDGRAAQLAIQAAAMREAVTLWPALDGRRLDETFPVWLELMLRLIGKYRSQSTRAAGRSYLAKRQLLVGVSPEALLRPAAPADVEWLTRAFGFSGPGLMQKPGVAANTPLSTTLGTTARIVADAGRATTIRTVAADRKAVGWYRLTDADPCDFCALLASRGIRYSETSFARANAKFVGDGLFKTHNHCGCACVPAFSRGEDLPDINSQADEIYRSLPPGNAAAKRKAFRAAWNARNN